jgi:hypothetical protein
MPRRNDDRARAKGGRLRTIPASAELMRLYADYLNSVYGARMILLGVVLLVSLLLGVARYGIQASVNDSRQYILFIRAALYMATFRPTVRLYDKIGHAWLIIGCYRRPPPWLSR